jgi:hypothetical protein
MPALIGRDPRRLTVAQLEALGHTKRPLTLGPVRK